ncbi:hypothetical protein Salat_1871000 [Sesamum alatum]|uniref:Uncharacterized protein n=1 Tax=Sesamum alatum TaxID=300844 RepID=A0AAE2CI61_9LAMI|nr:hypothetical protein Salat_1871000 [Sesamum alatum]
MDSGVNIGLNLSLTEEERVLEIRPWTFDKNLIVLEQIGENVNLWELSICGIRIRIPTEDIAGEGAAVFGNFSKANYGKVVANQDEDFSPIILTTYHNPSYVIGKGYTHKHLSRPTTRYLRTSYIFSRSIGLGRVARPPTRDAGHILQCLGIPQVVVPPANPAPDQAKQPLHDDQEATNLDWDILF